MLKNIRFGESKQLQLRAEAFNVFNHTNFKTIASTNVTAANFGSDQCDAQIRERFSLA